MKWGEFIQSLLHKPLLLFSTATTGVTSSDCLLAVSYAKLSSNGERPITGTLFYAAPSECALHGVDYHKITMHTLNTMGLSMRDFSDAVNQLFRETTPMSYNPAFQTMALTEMTECDYVHVADLPLLFKLAQSKMALRADELDAIVSISGLEKVAEGLVHNAPPLKRLMRANNIATDPYTDELPVVTNVQVLMRLWEMLAVQEMAVY